MYAGDILLLAPSVSSLQNLLCICDNELLNLDMCLNVMESMCTRISPRYKLKCSNLVTNNGREILRVDTVCYLGVFIVLSSRFCCSFDNAKKFRRAFNPVFSKVCRVASQNVLIELLMSKCVPVLYYGSECCPVSKNQFNPLEFALHGSFMKIFYTRSKEIGNYCMEMFNVQTPLYYNLVWYCRV